MKMNKVIISGGGTGGHIFPAIAIANALKAKYPAIDILFIGALGKMEMERVPQAGYEIVGLDIRGFQRKNIVANLKLPIQIISSLLKARQTIKKFKPELVIGVGGYASGPTLQMAQLLKIPTIIQEQNSFAGKTNLLLSKKARAICVGYEGMEKFFPKTPLFLTGNPVRNEIAQIYFATKAKTQETTEIINIKPNILILGGSLGARTINQAVIEHLATIKESEVDIIWQTGKFYYDEIAGNLQVQHIHNLHPKSFIEDMAAAYQSADLIISRAGALSVSELCLIGKPTLLVPSPNVAEDHQTKNAQALVNKDAAILIKDSDAVVKLIPMALEILNDKEKCKQLSNNILNLAKPNATDEIVAVIEKETHA